MKTAIIGSRSFADYATLKRNLSGLGIDRIISGGAIGTDSLADRYATEERIPIIVFKPEYTKYGRRAPIIRNKTIVDESECVVAFWDGISKGTKMVIDYARKTGKPTTIFQI